MSNHTSNLKNDLRIAITLPYLYMVRDFLFTPVWEEMAKRKDVSFFLLCSSIEAGRAIAERNCPNITFVHFPVASTNRRFLIRKLLSRDSMHLVRALAFQFLDNQYIFDSLIYRFTAINNLSNYEIRKNKNQNERKMQQGDFSYRKGESVGFPFPKSALLFRFLYSIRHSFINIARGEDVAVLKHLQADMAVFGGIQFPKTVYWLKAFHRLRVPIIGIVPSWDHPTTKGPIPRGMSGYIVASRRMVDELSSLHGIDMTKIRQIGKVQMDQYMNTSIFRNREDFLKELGIPIDHHLVTFGTNNVSLKQHEVSIAYKLSEHFVKGYYGKATLLLRTHPQDINWKKDFLTLAKPPWVLCHSASSFGYRKADSVFGGQNDQIMLANLMKHSDIVIQSRGSLALDAIAFDTPVISLAFDGDLPRIPSDSFLLEYAFEHYKPIVASQGTWMVGSYDELDRAILTYLGNPEIHSEGRKIIREEQIEPLDGQASTRLIDYIVDSAQKARESKLMRGDMDRTGLGDLEWSSRQVCDVLEYVLK